MTQLPNASASFNQVEAGGVSGGPGGAPVSDLSDDGDDPTSDNPTFPGDDGAGGVDDPTPLRIPLIDLEKELVGGPVIASSGVDGNFEVTYEFTVTNTGTTDLDTIAVEEDFIANMGSAFVGVVDGPTVTSTTATDNPDLHPPYDGGTSDADVFATAPATTPFLYGGSPSASYFDKQTVQSDNSYVIDPNQTYTYTADVSADDGSGGPPDPASTHYLGFASYDIDGNFINLYNYAKNPTAVDTTLAAPLNPGDLTITLTDGTGWHNGGTSHRRTLLWYGYQDSTGFTYPDYTYTRNFQSDIWDAGAVVGNTITLRNPWSGPALPAGEPVRNGTSGGSYQYVPLSNGHVDQTGAVYSAPIGGGFITDGATGQSLWRPGTHSIRTLALVDFGNHDTQLNINSWEIEAPNMSLMEPGQEVTFQITVEIDPDAPGAIYDGISGDGDGDLENQATVTAQDVLDNTPVSDNSDDPTDATDFDNEGDGDADDPVGLHIPNISLTKTQVGSPVPASSGTAGNFDVTFDLEITNTGNDDLDNLSLLEDLATQYGGAFVAVVPQGTAMATIQSSTATDDPEINSAYDGGTLDAGIIDSGAPNTNLLEAGQTVVVRIIVEVDPDNPGAVFVNNAFENQATVAGDGVNSGITVDDDSDDPTNVSDDNNDADNDPDDPNLLVIPDMNLIKDTVSFAPAASGTAGNYDITFDLTIQNTGNDPLTQLTLTENFVANYGGAFVQMVGVPTITASTATDDPEINAAYDGGLIDPEVFDNSGANTNELDLGEEVTIRVVVEVNPNAATANIVDGSLENQAQTTGQGSSGPADDLSDDPADTAQDDGDPFDPADDDNNPDDPNLVRLPQIELTKDIVGTPVLASSGVGGHYDVTYALTLTNTGTTPLDSLTLTENLVSHFGGAFVAIVPQAGAPAVITSSGAADDPGVNTAFDGGFTDSNIFDGSPSLLQPNQSITVEIIVEVDPNNAFASYDQVSSDGDSDLENQASVTGTDPVTSQLVDDNSDDTTDSTNNDDDGDNDADDPTGLIIPEITLQKQLVGSPIPAASGTANNWDVTYDFVITNSGNEALNSLQLTEDLLTQYAGAFVGIVPQSGAPATIAASTATDDPEINASYDGGFIDDELFDNSGANASLLDVGESVTIRIIIETNPNNPTAALTAGNLVNQATVEGTGDTSGTMVDDDSDDPNDLTDADNDGDNEADDPNTVRVPDIALEKEVIGGVASTTTPGTYDVTYELTFENLGTTPLNNLQLVEDFATHFGPAYNSIVPQGGGVPATIAASSATNDPGINPAYDGGTTDANIFDSSASLLLPNQSITISIIANIDPNAPGTVYDSVTGDGDLDLENQAEVTGEDPANPGAPVTDESDDPTDFTNNDGDGDNEPDDPTGLRIPEINLTKTLVGSPVAATSGIAGNFEVTYDLMIESTGNDALVNLSLTEDLLSQYGGAFVQIVGSPTIVASTATDDPEINAGYDGGTTDDEIFDNSGANTNELAMGETITVRIVIEINPDAPTAIYTNGDLVNQADATGDGETTGMAVNDPSDDPNDATDDDPNNDANPDDPNALRIPDISLTKIVSSTTPPSKQADGTWNVVFEMEMSNTGTTVLQNLSLMDDISSVSNLGTTWLSTVSVSIDTSMVTTAPGPALNAAWQTDPTQDMLDGTGTMNPGDVVTITYEVNIDPDISGASTSPFVNQALAEGEDPQDPGNPVDDPSDDTTDVTDTDPNGDGNPDDPTAIEIPDIGVAKQLNNVTTVGTGRFNAEYVVIVENTGTIDLLNINVTEDLVAEFGNGFVGVVAGPTVTGSNLSAGASLPTINTAGFDGDGASDPLLVNGGGLLEPGDNFTITFTIEVDTTLPDGTDTTPPMDFTNTVTATGEGPDGEPATDDSDDGTNPNTNNGDGSEDTPTSFLVPQIRAKKTHGAYVPSVDSSGNYTVPVTIEVFNTGSVDLSNLTLFEDIASQWGNAYVSVSNPSIGPGTVFTGGSSVLPTLNGAWGTGNEAVNIIDTTAANLLIPGDSFVFTFDVVVDPDEIDGSSQFNDNQATVTGDGTDFDSSTTTADDESGWPEETISGVDNDESTPLIIPEVILEKIILDQVPATSGTQGNLDVTYLFRYTNSGTVTLVNPTITDDWATQYGAAFVQVVDTDLSDGNVTSPATSGINGNAAYAGAASDNMLDGLGQILPGETVTVAVVVEVDPDAAPTNLVNGQLVNQADAEGTYDPTPGTPGDEIVVDDPSDDPDDFTDINPDGDGDPDDPNVLSVADIELTKDISNVVPASGGISDNFDVTFDLVVTNTGTETLSNLSLLDDIATQYGGAFVGVVNVSVLPGSATMAPAPNSGYTGMAGSDMLLGSAGDVVEAGQSFTVQLTVEVDPDAATANYDGVTGDGSGNLENSANVSGDGEHSGTVSDTSDDTTDLTNTNDDPTEDNNPDDPTGLIIPAIDIEKTAVGTPVPASSGTEGNFDITYDLVITNTGTEQLNSLTLQEDLATQYGGGFIAIVPQGGAPATIVTSTAFNAPEINAAYDGGATDAELFDNNAPNVNALNVGDSVTVRIVIEIDPDAALAVTTNGDFVNQATVTGTGADSGNMVDDLSDDPNNATNADGDPADPLDDDNNPDDPNTVRFPQISLDKQVFGTPVPASSGTHGNFDVFYDLTITNTGSTPLENLSLQEDFASHFGGAFVAVVPQGIVLARATMPASTATDNPEISTTYDGSADPEIFNNSAPNTNLLNVGESITIRVLVEIDPDSTTATYNQISGCTCGALENQASTAGTDPGGAGTVTDDSDEPTDATEDNNDPGSDNDPDDPTPIYLPAINLEKNLVGTPVPSASGTTGNFDVTYDLVITNIGNEDLVQLSLVEDLAAQYGGGFIQTVGPATIVSTTATDAPEINSAYDGGATDAQLFDNSGTNINLLRTDQTVTVRIVVEIDPDAPTAIRPNGDLENQADVTGVGTETGTLVEDPSDDTTNPTDADGDPANPADDDNNPDDPNELRLPQISLEKTKFGAPVPASSGTEGNYDVTYDLTITNIGSTDLVSLSLVEDFVTQFGGAFEAIVLQGAVPATIVSSTATDNPEINSNYDGGITDAEIFDNSAPNTNLLPVGASITIRIIAEVDPNNVGAIYDSITGDGNNDLENQATTAGTDPAPGGETVSDTSDEPADTTDVDGDPSDPGNSGDDDNDPDDPTPLIIPEISLDKTLVGTPVVASSGTYGNFELTYDLQITNTGNDPLSSVTLNEDLAAQYGGAFVQIVGPPAIVATTATDDPEINAAYDGGTTNAQLFDNSAPNTNLLGINETVTVRIVIEVDPDSPTATYVNDTLENQATTTGFGEGSGDIVDDLSDDPNDFVEEDGTPGDPSDDDNNPDDPNNVRIPLISLEKTLAGTPVPAASGTAGNFDATYEFTLSNDGTTPLNLLTLTEDFATHFGGAFVTVVGSPSITASTATVDPVINLSYNGSSNAEVFDGASGQLDVNQTVTVSITVEVDPDSPTAIYDGLTGDGNTDLENQASTTGTDSGDPAGPTTVDDTSDDPTDLTDTDGDPSDPGNTADDDNDPDDPVSLIMPDITLEKTLVGTPVPASSGAPGNVDVTYDLMILNTGNEPLNTLSLMEDLSTQYGGAFVQIVPQAGVPATIVASTATDVPEINGAYDGGATDADLRQLGSQHQPAGHQRGRHRPRCDRSRSQIYNNGSLAGGHDRRW